MKNNKKKFYLCYIDNEKNKAYFTSDWENQSGDDWNDRPYECNAGLPYEYNYNAPEQGIENGKGIYPIIEQKKLFFDFENRWDVHQPYELGRISVDDINRGAVAWLWGDDFVIPAKTEYNDFIEIVEKNGGKIYLPKEAD